MTEEQLKTLKPAFYNTKPEFEDKIHGVMIAFEVRGITERNLQKLKDMYSKFGLAKLQPIVLFTKLDMCDPALRDFPQNVFESPEVEQWKEYLLKETKYPAECIFPIINYNGKIEGKPEVTDVFDYLALKALHTELDSYVTPFLISQARKYHLESTAESSPKKGIPLAKEEILISPQTSPTKEILTEKDEPLTFYVINELTEEIQELYITKPPTYFKLEEEIQKQFEVSVTKIYKKLNSGEKVTIASDKNVEKLLNETRIYFSPKS